MPANLTPQFRRAEEQYRQAQTPLAKIQSLELMLQLIPKHKGTDRLQGDLRARLKEARSELQADQSSGKSGRSYRIPRQGAGTVVIIGAPNAGKSRLLHELTSAQPEVAPYPFTTREPQAGMMTWEDLQIQLIDTPPITRNFLEAYLISFIRSADLVLLCINGSDDDAVTGTLDLLQETDSRKTRLSSHSGFDEVDRSIVHVKTICVITHADAADLEERLELLQQMRPMDVPSLRVRLDDADDVEELRTAIARSLPILRIYTRRPGSDIADPAPTVLPPGATVEELARKIHDDLAAQLKFAKVWNVGNTAGRTVQRDHPLEDLDTVELFT
ncbi:GTPase [Planctomicrobium sp. SH661]|uniref:GTPase n=1 Tax=Planctomicrobium sp. SH661 TaxID=3448124 RepID=UPI003F5C6482